MDDNWRAMIDAAKAENERGTPMRGGKRYTSVAIRNEIARRHLGERIGILTEIVHWAPERGALIVVKATIMRTDDGRELARGHAEEIRGQGNVNTTSALENAETSAIGRALANLGLSGGEFASANELEGAERKKEAMSAPQRTPEPPHDPHTGEVYSERNPPPTGTPEADKHDPADDGAGTYRAMRDGILDALKITPEFDANGRMKKLPPAEAELFAKAYAASLITKITNYKREQAMNMFLSVHEKGIDALPKELQTDVWEAAWETRDRINGKHLPPRDPIVLGDVQVTDDAGRPI